MYTIARTHTPYLTRAMALLAGTLTLFVFLYGIFLLEAVGNTARRASAEREVRSLTSKVSQLEQTYLSLTRELTLERAHSLGFVAPAEVTTVFATAQSRSLTLNH
ncbi:MAG: hypothetical protein G01um101456_121 [Parcubacteria group bacterium Gr01-1014_56]|nr:MAG: hypothetical protein G01um101456_121 [Parcubacteria group bacterium Gr01-1014_56]